MTQQKRLVGHVRGPKGDKGDAGVISEVLVSVDAETLEQPTATATVGGESEAQVISFEFHGLKGAKGDPGLPSGWESKTTTFNADGSITEETPSQKVETVFNGDGSITETLYEGEFKAATRTTVFGSDTITETVEEA